MAQPLWRPDIDQGFKDLNRSSGEKISVCLLTYNHAHLIESTLRSILDQTITGYQVIVSDDCSTDGTWELVQRLAASDSRIKAIQTPRNQGMPGNGNFAVGHTDRPYVALLHHDDIYEPDLLEKWVNILERYPRVSFVFNPYGIYGSDFVYRDEMPGDCISGLWLLRKYLLPRWGCLVRGTALIRRTAWEQVGGLREEFGLLSDIDLWMRLSFDWDVGYVDEPIIRVRQMRPDDYPEDYKDDSWSWRRQVLLYQIHAANRLELFDLDSITGRLQWWQFRLRLSIETGKWLLYALVRGKKEMIRGSSESSTAFDLLPLRIFRKSLQWAYSSSSKNCD